MGRNIPDNNSNSNNRNHIIKLSEAEAAKGCLKEMLVDGHKYLVSIPAGTKAGDVIEFRSRNDSVICTFNVSIISSDNDRFATYGGVKTKRTVNPWIFIAAGIAIAAIIAVIVCGGIGVQGVSYSKAGQAGISFVIPSDWSEDTEWHDYEYTIRESWRWDPSDEAESDAGICIDSINRNRESTIYEFEEYYKNGIEAFGKDRYAWMADEEDYQVLDDGWITIDGTKCWFVEYDSHDYDDQFGFNSYEIYIPVSEDQVTTFEFSIEKGSINSDSGLYEENPYYKMDKKLRKKVINSIHITGTGEPEYGLPDYEEKKYSFEGIIITLPEEFEINAGSDSSIYWGAPFWSDMFVNLRCQHETEDAVGVARRDAESACKYKLDDEDYTGVDMGSVDIDGATAYYSEYTHLTEYGSTYYYELNIPIEKSRKVIELSVDFERGGIWTDTDRELLSKIISSIRIR